MIEFIDDLHDVGAQLVNKIRCLQRRFLALHEQFRSERCLRENARHLIDKTHQQRETYRARAVRTLETRSTREREKPKIVSTDVTWKES